MNLCHDCNSEYATPGTCNCFAPGGKRHAPLLTYGVPLVVGTATLTPSGEMEVWFDDGDTEELKS